MKKYHVFWMYSPAGLRVSAFDAPDFSKAMVRFSKECLKDATTDQKCASYELRRYDGVVLAKLELF